MRIRYRADGFGAFVDQQRGDFERRQRRAAIIATDKASRDGQAMVRSAMAGANLGKLGRAVGQTSMRRKGDDGRSQPWGAIFARGGDESRAGGALEAYSRGAYITARQGKWLAFATKAIPSMTSAGGRRRRMTPALFQRSALSTSIGKLVFRKTRNPNVALLVIRRVSLSPKTGRAKRATGRERSRVVVPEVAAFILIRATRRMKRFDHVALMRSASHLVPGYMADALQSSSRP